MQDHDSLLLPGTAESGHEVAPNFSDFMQTAIAQERQQRGIIYPGTLSRTAELLNAHGLGPEVVNPAAAPPYLAEFGNEDWRSVQDKQIEDPSITFLALWSRANRRRAQGIIGMKPFDVRAYSGREDIEQMVANTVLWQVAPVTHGTTLQALERALNDGFFISSGEALDRYGIDYEWDGRTYADDRKARLDRYVFGNCPRPHSFYMGDVQSPVIAVLSHDAMHQPGSFITSDELEEEHFRGTVNDRSASTSYERHMATVALPEDFEIVGREALHALNGRGGLQLEEVLAGEDLHPAPPYDNIITFSAFETKMPRTPISTIRKLLFRSPDDASAFTERNGHHIAGVPIEVVPDLRAALGEYGRDVLGYHSAYNEAYQRALSTDPRLVAFDERLRVLGPEGVRQDALRHFFGMGDGAD